MKNDLRWILLNVGVGFVIVGFFLLISCLLGCCTMGTPLPPNEPGDLCDVVFGIGGRFEGQTQPRRVRIQFEGFSAGAGWDGTFGQSLLMQQTLIQLPNPCQYEIISGGMQWFLWWREHSSLVSIEEDGGVLEFFRGDEPVNGALELSNDLLDGPNVACLGGHVKIDWLPPEEP